MKLIRERKLAMVTPQNVQRLVADLHEAKILNGDTTVNQVMQAASKSSALAEALQVAEGQVKPDWYIIGGSGYVAVCK